MGDDESDDEFAAALERELENAAAAGESESVAAQRPSSPPPPAPAPPQPAASPSQKRQRTVVRRRSVSGPSSTPSETGGGSGPSDASAPPRADAGADGGDVGFMWGMDVVTGMSAGGTSSPSHRPAVQLTYGSYRGMVVSGAEMARIKADERAELVAKKKCASVCARPVPGRGCASRACARGCRLSLVLDLDHTLLNSATYSELSPEAHKRLEPIAVPQTAAEPAAPTPGSAGDPADGASAPPPAAAAGAGAREPFTELHHLRHLGMWTKLRPGARAFLSGVSDLFELYVYTMGTCRYARRCDT